LQLRLPGKLATPWLDTLLYGHPCEFERTSRRIATVQRQQVLNSSIKFAKPLHDENSSCFKHPILFEQVRAHRDKLLYIRRIEIHYTGVMPNYDLHPRTYTHAGYLRLDSLLNLQSSITCVRPKHNP